MKRKLLVLCLSLAVLFAVCLGISACDKPLKELSAPQNIQQENRVLTWDKVDDASGYILFINGKEYETTENRFELYSFTRGGEFTAKVMAIGDGKTYDDSSWTNAAFSLEAPIEHGYDEAGWEYTFLEDEFGYEVSKGNANLEGDVVIPDFFEGFPVVRLADHALYPDPNLSDTIPPNPYTGFLCNLWTTSLKLPSRLRSIGWLSLACMLKIEELEIPETVTAFDQMSFQSCLNLKRVNIPEGITTIPYSCFFETGLEELVLPNGLEKIETGAFCNPFFVWESGHTDHAFSNLASVVIPDSVKTIGSSAFRGRENLRNVTMSKNIELIGDRAFEDTAWYNAQPDGIIYFRNNEILYTYKGEMAAHTELIVPSSVKLISYNAFYGQDNLEKVFIPDGVKLRSAVFSYCRSLKEVRLPADLEELPNNTFTHTSLQSITIPEKVTKIGSLAFSHCKSLEEITLNDKLEIIGERAFLNCSSLTTITIPSSVRTIEKQVFDSSALSEVIFESVSDWSCEKKNLALETEMPYGDVSKEELSSPSNAALLLTSTWKTYEWTRKEN